jgi:hypothetical protein
MHYLFARRFDFGLRADFFAATRRFAIRLVLLRAEDRGFRSTSARFLATARAMTVVSFPSRRHFSP